MRLSKSKCCQVFSIKVREIRRNKGDFQVSHLWRENASRSHRVLRLDEVLKITNYHLIHVKLYLELNFLAQTGTQTLYLRRNF